MAINQEKKQYILRHLDHYIDELVWNVLGNDPEDPHYSAVTATNCIKCYIELCGELGENPPYSNVEGYLRASAKNFSCLPCAFSMDAAVFL